MIARLFEAGADVFRINMSHTSHDRMRELVGAIRSVESEPQPADRHPGRPARAEAARRRLRRTGQRCSIPAPPLRSTPIPTPGDATRVHLPHPEIFEGVKPGHTLLLDDGKIRLIATEASRREDRHPRRGRRQAVRPQGREPARHRDPVLGADAEGPLRSGSRPRHRRRLDRAVVHPAAGGHRGSQEDRARTRRGDGQDREAAGGAPAGRDRRRHRRDHGGARRPRRGNAAGKGAGHPEAAHARRAQGRQAGGGGDADARKHDFEPGADARRGVRRRDRDLRRRRRGDAVGGIGGRPISGRSGRRP